MKRLILMRHAKTEPWFAGEDDESRALVPRGKTDAACIAAEMRRLGWIPDEVLLSSARRTRETWLAMQDTLVTPAHKVLEGLYLAGTAYLQSLITAHDTTQTLMLIGHNPGIHDLAVQISSQAGAADQQAALTLSAKMPTSAAALFEAKTACPFEPVHFRLIDYIVAKSLRSDMS